MIVKSYYSNGKLKSELNLIDDSLNGEIIYYDKSGFLKYKGEAENKKLEIIVKEYTSFFS